MHNQANTGNTRLNNSTVVTNEELGVIRSLFELLVKLPSHIRYDTIAWAIERKDPSMLKLVTMCHLFGMHGYIHYYFLTPDKFRQLLFAPKIKKLNAVQGHQCALA